MEPKIRPTLVVTLARVLAILALALTVLPLSTSSAAASTNGYTSGTNVAGAQAVWSNGCPTEDGVQTCVSSVLDVVGIDSHGSTDGASQEQRVCLDTSASSYPAEDVSAQGGGGGTEVTERGCITVGRDKLQIDGLSSATLSPVTIPLNLCVLDEYQDCHWVYSRDVTIAATFQATTPTVRGWWYIDRDGWYPDGCFQVDRSVSQYREASVHATVDGIGLPKADLMGASIQHRTSNYTETCKQG